MGLSGEGGGTSFHSASTSRQASLGKEAMFKIGGN
jgi:hypothetical protein